MFFIIEIFSWKIRNTLGMKLVKVYIVLNWHNLIGLKNTLTLIQTKEKNAANSFERDFLKLMNNSTFGKTMENLRKRVNVRLVNNAEDYKNYISKPSLAKTSI